MIRKLYMLIKKMDLILDSLDKECGEEAFILQKMQVTLVVDTNTKKVMAPMYLLLLEYLLEKHLSVRVIPH